jgi:TolA-binding protein
VFHYDVCSNSAGWHGARHTQASTGGNRYHHALASIQKADANGNTGMPKLDEQISTLEERLKQLKLRQQRSDARKRAIDAQRERKSETRRRFLLGAVIQAKVQEGEMDAGRLREWLDQALTRKDDRALFDLPPRPDLPSET